MLPHSCNEVFQILLAIFFNFQHRPVELAFTRVENRIGTAITKHDVQLNGHRSRTRGTARDCSPTDVVENDPRRSTIEINQPVKRRRYCLRVSRCSARFRKRVEHRVAIVCVPSSITIVAQDRRTARTVGVGGCHRLQRHASF